MLTKTKVANLEMISVLSIVEGKIFLGLSPSGEDLGIAWELVMIAAVLAAFTGRTEVLV